MNLAGLGVLENSFLNFDLNIEFQVLRVLDKHKCLKCNTVFTFTSTSVGPWVSEPIAESCLVWGS